MPERMPEFVSPALQGDTPLTPENSGYVIPGRIGEMIRRPLEIKDTNPKDAIGSTKLDMGAVPDTAIAYLALAFLEGALKYGRYNWRIAGVRSSIYHAAIKRHLAKYWNGEWADPKTKVPHLASIMACCAIILDAEHLGKLTDDRPPASPGLSELIDSMSGAVAHLVKEFEGHNPKQYTINDK